MPDLTEIASHLATALGGAGALGAVLRFRRGTAKDRVERVEKLEAKVDGYVEKIGTMQGLVAELQGHSLRMEEKLQESEERCQRAREEDARRCAEATTSAVREAEARLTESMQREVRGEVRRTLSPAGMQVVKDGEG